MHGLLKFLIKIVALVYQFMFINVYGAENLPNVFAK
jgi:hypothetical protein